MAKQVTAIYPGSFDPVTHGHLDIVKRSRGKFDRIIVAVLVNLEKKPLFTTEKRVAILREVTGQWNNVAVDTFEGLLVNYAKANDAHVILRAIRAVTDYEYEFQMALMNRKLNEQVETLFMMPRASYSFLSSHLVKEIATLGGDVSAFVTPEVRAALSERLGQVGAN